MRVRGEPRTSDDDGLLIRLSSREGTGTSAVLHLIEVPGREPVEIGMFQQLCCRTCLAETRPDDGRVVVLHSSQCAGARAVGEAIGEQIPCEQTDEARRALADEYVDEIVDDDQRLLRIAGTTEPSEGQIVALRGQLSEIYLAGFQRGERLVLASAKASLSRLRKEIDETLARLDAWSPAGASSGS